MVAKRNEFYTFLRRIHINRKLAYKLTVIIIRK